MTNETRHFGDDIADRLLGFATGALRLAATLPDTPAGLHLRQRLVVAGTAGGARYEVARCAAGRLEFADGVQFAAQATRDAVYWLRVVDGSHLTDAAGVAGLIDEGTQLTRILMASARTARLRAAS
jgi:hypothetical protein